MTVNRHLPQCERECINILGVQHLRLEVLSEEHETVIIEALREASAAFQECEELIVERNIIIMDVIKYRKIY